MELLSIHKNRLVFNHYLQCHVIYMYYYFLSRLYSLCQRVYSKCKIIIVVAIKYKCVFLSIISVPSCQSS